MHTLRGCAEMTMITYMSGSRYLRPFEDSGTGIQMLVVTEAILASPYSGGIQTYWFTGRLCPNVGSLRL